MKKKNKTKNRYTVKIIVIDYN